MMIIEALPLYLYIMQGIWICFLDTFHTLLLTGDNQFGLKKGIGCNHMRYILVVILLITLSTQVAL